MDGLGGCGGGRGGGSTRTDRVVVVWLLFPPIFDKERVASRRLPAAQPHQHFGPNRQIYLSLPQGLAAGA